MLRPIRVGLLLVGLSLSCATERVGQTAYRPRDDSGCGYSEIQTGARTLEVTFVGQSSVDAHEGVMRRAAELSLQHGFDQFIIVSREDHPEEVIRKTHIVAHVRQKLTGTTMRIWMRTHSEPEGGHQVLDAHAVASGQTGWAPAASSGGYPPPEMGYPAPQSAPPPQTGGPPTAGEPSGNPAPLPTLPLPDSSSP